MAKKTTGGLHPIGTGESGHSGGHGRGQGGQGNWGGHVAKKNPGKAIMDHTPSGKGGPGYNTEAHSDSYHHNGEAVGHHSDHGVFDYRTTLHSEKSGMNPVPDHGRAAHHTQGMGEAHKFKTSNSGMGFGHSSGQMKGPLRMSGHPRAHRIGCK